MFICLLIWKHDAKIFANHNVYIFNIEMMMIVFLFIWNKWHQITQCFDFPSNQLCDIFYLFHIFFDWWYCPWWIFSLNVMIMFRNSWNFFKWNIFDFKFWKNLPLFTWINRLIIDWLSMNYKIFKKCSKK